MLGRQTKARERRSCRATAKWQSGRSEVSCAKRGFARMSSSACKFAGGSMKISRRLLPGAAVLLVYVLWVFVVLYPNPTLLARSIPQALDPDVDPAAVRKWADELPDDPAYIERRVLDEYVPYSVPWQTVGVPWYFPTTEEVVAQGSGDCQARMLVLASILEAKGIPYRLEASLDHIWVWYPGKKPTAMENGAIALMFEEDGSRKLRLPKEWDWRESYRIEKDYFWDTMPTGRKLVLFAGLGAIFFRGRLTEQLSKVRAALTPAGRTPPN